MVLVEFFKAMVLECFLMNSTIMILDCYFWHAQKLINSAFGKTVKCKIWRSLDTSSQASCSQGCRTLLCSAAPKVATGKMSWRSIADKGWGRRRVGEQGHFWSRRPAWTLGLQWTIMKSRSGQLRRKGRPPYLGVPRRPSRHCKSAISAFSPKPSTANAKLSWKSSPTKRRWLAGTTAQGQN